MTFLTNKQFPRAHRMQFTCFYPAVPTSAHLWPLTWFAPCLSHLPFSFLLFVCTEPLPATGPLHMLFSPPWMLSFGSLNAGTFSRFSSRFREDLWSPYWCDLAPACLHCKSAEGLFVSEAVKGGVRDSVSSSMLRVCRSLSCSEGCEMISGKVIQVQIS